MIGMANSEGEFVITLSKDNVEIEVKCVGYDPQKISLDSFLEDRFNRVNLVPKLTVLPEVIILPGKLHEEVLGFQDVPQNHKVYSFGEFEYTAIAKKFKIKNQPSRLEEASIYIGKNVIGVFTLRCRITKKAKGNIPGEDILLANVTVHTDVQKGWVNFNLNPFNVWAGKKKIFLVIEVLQDYSINDNNFVPKVNTPGFAYVPNQGTSYISTKPDIWRGDIKDIIMKLRISYDN